MPYGLFAINQHIDVYIDLLQAGKVLWRILFSLVKHLRKTKRQINKSEVSDRTFSLISRAPIFKKWLVELLYFCLLVLHANILWVVRKPKSRIKYNVYAQNRFLVIATHIFNPQKENLNVYLFIYLVSKKTFQTLVIFL